MRSGTQPLDPLQFSFLAPEIGCCQVNFAFPSYFSYFPKSLLTGKERLGEERQKGESRPGLLLSLCNFRLLIPEITLSCWQFPAQCVVLSSSFGNFIFVMALKNQGTLPLCGIFSFHLFFSTESTMPFHPFCPVLIQNSKLSSKETHSRPNCIAFPCFLLSVALFKEAYISHELSQENGSQESIFLTHVSPH